MRDLILYRMLGEPELDVDALVPALEAIDAIPVARRAPWVGRLARARSHPDARLRAAAVRALRSVGGVLGVRAMVDALHDGDPGVRAAACDALASIVDRQPLRIAHLVFHPDPEVRRRSLAQATPATIAVHIHLLSDPDLREDVLARRLTIGASQLDVAFSLYRAGTLAPRQLQEWLSSVDAAQLTVWARKAPSRSAHDAHRILVDRDTDAVGKDRLDAVFDVFARHDSDDATRQRLFRSWQRYLAHVAWPLTQEVAASIIQAGERHRHTREAFAAAAEHAPQILAWSHVPRPIREHAVSHILRWRGGKRVHDAVLVPLLKCDLAKREDGRLDLAFFAAVLLYKRAERYAWLVDRVDLGAIVAAFLADPIHGAPFLTLDDRSARGREWMIGELRKAAKDEAMIVALGVLLGQARSLESAQSWNMERRFALASWMLKLSTQPGLQPADKQAAALAQGLVPRFAHGARLLTEWLETAAPQENVLGREMVRRLARVTDPEPLAALLAALPAKLLRRALDAFDAEALLSLTQERALANRLRDHPSSAATAWAAERLRVAEPRAARAAFVPSEGATPLSEEDAHAILAGAELAEEALRASLLRRTTGMAAALAARRTAGPSVLEAVALLASEDPIEVVAAELGRWIDAQDATFMSALEEATVDHLGARSQLPLHAQCWLFRFERHGLAAAERLSEGEGGLGASLAFASAALAEPELIARIYATAARAIEIWRRRSPADLARLGDVDAILGAAIDELDRDAGIYAAILIRSLSHTAIAEPALAGRHGELHAKMADCADPVRAELGDLVAIEGLAPRALGARSGLGSGGSRLAESLRSSHDVDALARACRDARPAIVHEAVLRLVALGPAALEILAALLAEDPEPVHAVAIATSLSFWPEGDPALEAVRAWLRAGHGTSGLRFAVALALMERGEADAEPHAIEAACAPSLESHATQNDATRFFRATSDLDAACRALSTSSQPALYAGAVERLLARGTPTDPDLAAVRAFLDAGTDRRLELRVRAAWWLHEHGDDAGMPLVAGLAIEGHPLVSTDRWPAREALELTHASVEGALHDGDRERELRALTMLSLLAPDDAEPLLERALAEATDLKTRSAALQRMRERPQRARKLRRVAEIFAWGYGLSRELAGRTLRPHMISGDELGFTRLDENRIFVSPLPVLRGERAGDEVVEGLVLHEIGHHRYHRGPEEQIIWNQAQGAGLGWLLNLVADEHLERNLRAYDRSYGDRLKRLDAYAFQHAARHIHVPTLLDALGADAFDVLIGCRLGAGARADAVCVDTGPVLGELERRGSSFARFMRALRMGLGNRYDDEKVARGLALFGPSFRKSSMARLYSITLELHDIFGDEVVKAQAFGGSESIEADPHDAVTHGEGIGDDELQGEVERVLGAPDKSRSGKPARGTPRRPVINVGSDESFHTIEEVIAVKPNHDRHRELAREVDRHARRLRAHLDRLGLNHVERRMRLTGRRVDVTRLLPLVTRRDPRVLIAREVRIETDLFLGMVIDCSGSMAGTSMARAHAFGVLLTEAMRGVRNADLRIFGFDDQRIFDAGDARRPAVTSLAAGAGNNDAAGLWHAAQVAMRSPRKAKVLVMISDGLPTECSVAALRGLVRRLVTRHAIVCAQVAVRPLAEVCFPHYVEVDEANLDRAVGRFGTIIASLVGRTLKRG
ncbi:MAG: HEAT repeat domain-containing protein [Sandaracinaceae bacterium]